ncbi:hypothetical protein BU16DRAFT_554197 [Lophium mytilinum]|uniref:Uncharacterized protein n=1 Tax=Lophium mytilinum TaxID=390894 RepID=A0A6A6RCE0_9PEZI|nr:hypothetical protein BU16DRAFT_554197 [Lophium mytilinum]
MGPVVVAVTVGKGNNAEELAAARACRRTTFMTTERATSKICSNTHLHGFHTPNHAVTDLPYHSIFTFIQISIAVCIALVPALAIIRYFYVLWAVPRRSSTAPACERRYRFLSTRFFVWILVEPVSHPRQREEGVYWSLANGGRLSDYSDQMKTTTATTFPGPQPICLLLSHPDRALVFRLTATPEPAHDPPSSPLPCASSRSSSSR